MTIYMTETKRTYTKVKMLSFQILISLVTEELVTTSAHLETVAQKVVSVKQRT